MKRWLAILLAMTMLLALTACGGTADAPADGSDGINAVGEASAAEASVEEYVDVPAAANVLDAASPIPADTGTLALTEDVFESQHLTVAHTEDMTLAAEDGAVTVTSGDGVWTIRFQQFENTGRTNLLNNITNYYVSAGVEVFPDRSDVETTLAGFPAHVYATNIKESWINPEEDWMVPAVDVIVDYGSALVGHWAGLWIRLTSNDYDNYANIYDVLNLRHVRAVLNNFSVIEGDAGTTVSVGGITATFPGRWAAHGDTWTGPWAAIREDGGQLGAVYIQSSTPADPAEAAGYLGDTFTRTYGDREYVCAFRSNSLEDEASYSLDLYSEFSDERCLDVRLNLGRADQDTLLAFADTENFTAVMNSIQVDPSGYVDPDKGVDESGFVRNNNGVLTGYEGSATELVIPSNISGMDTVGIGDHVFAENTAITSVTIPETVSYIDACAFENCTNLETVAFPSALSYIGYNAFRGCEKLKDVTLPDSVTTVDQMAFEFAGTGSFSAGPGVWYGSSCFSNSGFDSITIGAQSDISEQFMFMYAAASSITLGDGITAIGSSAFRDTHNLTELTIPDSVTTLGDSAFYSCGATTIHLPEGITDIPEFCFFLCECDPLILPESVTHIASNGVDNPVLVLQSGSLELESNAISTNYLLLPKAHSPEDVNFPLDSDHFWIGDQVMIAMDGSMEEMSAFDSYLDEHGLGTIAWFGVSPELIGYAPRDCEFTQYTLSKYNGSAKALCMPFWNNSDGLPVEIIGENAFAGSDLERVVIHASIYELQAGAFADCKNLTDIWFTSAILTKPDEDPPRYAAGAFSGLPDGVTVHLPACLSDAERNTIEAYIKTLGIPDTAAFDYYSMR